MRAGPLPPLRLLVPATAVLGWLLRLRCVLPPPPTLLTRHTSCRAALRLPADAHCMPLLSSDLQAARGSCRAASSSSLESWILRPLRRSAAPSQPGARSSSGRLSKRVRRAGGCCKGIWLFWRYGCCPCCCQYVCASGCHDRSAVRSGCCFLACCTRCCHRLPVSAAATMCSLLCTPCCSSGGAGHLPAHDEFAPRAKRLGSVGPQRTAAECWRQRHLWGRSSSRNGSSGSGKCSKPVCSDVPAAARGAAAAPAAAAAAAGAGGGACQPGAAGGHAAGWGAARPCALHMQRAGRARQHGHVPGKLRSLPAGNVCLLLASAGWTTVADVMLLALCSCAFLPVQVAHATSRSGTLVSCVCSPACLPARLPRCVLQGRGCGVWQHCDCLGLAAPPAKFLCELCRCVGRMD